MNLKKKLKNIGKNFKITLLNKSNLRINSKKRYFSAEKNEVAFSDFYPFRLRNQKYFNIILALSSEFIVSNSS